MKGTEGAGGGGAGLAKKSFGVMCQPRMEGGRDGVGGMGVQGRQSADCSESELKSASAEEGSRRRIKS